MTGKPTANERVQVRGEDSEIINERTSTRTVNIPYRKVNGPAIGRENGTASVKDLGIDWKRTGKFKEGQSEAGALQFKVRMLRAPHRKALEDIGGYDFPHGRHSQESGVPLANWTSRMKFTLPYPVDADFICAIFDLHPPLRDGNVLLSTEDLRPIIILRREPCPGHVTARLDRVLLPTNQTTASYFGSPPPTTVSRFGSPLPTTALCFAPNMTGEPAASDRVQVSREKKILKL
ncbi:hypothetical protein C8J57DRAFT_1459817 [Mycena rebaudengoi]|nr:hypothetical protein C8J57DRAFT_1459817 [Mycena rebaudengoi]